MSDFNPTIPFRFEVCLEKFFQICVYYFDFNLFSYFFLYWCWSIVLSVCLYPSNRGEIIRSIRRTADVVLLDLSTNKMQLFMQMWHHLIIFISYSMCWLGNSHIHLHRWYHLIVQGAPRAGSTSFGALGENFKWGLFIIKY